ncbi:MAG: response regulator [Balneolaceae bacterium]
MALLESLWNEPLMAIAFVVIFLLIGFNLFQYLKLRKRAQSFYKNENYQASLQAISTYSPNAILLLDNQGVIQFANQKFLDLFGTSLPHIDGEKYHFTQLPDEFIKCLASDDKMCFSISNSNGEKEYHYVYVHPIVSDSNHKFGELLIVEPKTKLQSLSQVERLESNIEKLSHNLRTPLNSILGYCQLLMGERELNDDQKNYLNTISENSYRLLNQINVLLKENDQVDSGRPIQDSVSGTKPKCIEKILIVDDVSINRTFLRIMLERHGYQLIEAQNGQEALERIIQDCPDLVLMDIMMPVMDGLETLETIRSYDERYSELPVIAVTANSRRSNRKKLIEAGFNGYLQKPFKEKDLLKMISN